MKLRDMTLDQLLAEERRWRTKQTRDTNKREEVVAHILDRTKATNEATKAMIAATSRPRRRKIDTSS